MRDRRSILVLRADHLGDAILTTPLLRALAKAGHAVDLVLPRAHLPLFADSPRLRRRTALEKAAPGWRRNPFSLAAWMRSGGYDTLILPYAQPWPLAAASFLSGIPERIAMWGGVAGRLTGHRCLRSGLPERPRYMADILLDCARALGVPEDGLRPEIFPSGGDATRPPNRPPRVGIHPGCAGNTCNFSPAGYGEIARLILERTDWEITVTGGPAERALLAGWPSEVLTSPRLRDTVGRLPLEELARTIGALDLFISTGTGPFHVAVALGTATLTPFCTQVGISRAVWGNPNPNGHFLEAASCACEPGRLCDFRGKIAPIQVFERSRALIDGAPSPSMEVRAP